MSYLGKQPATQGKDAGPAVKIDDIASNFNGSVTVFDLAVESTAVNPHPNNLAVYLNGVLQHPGDSYAVSGSQIKFNEAPDTGLSFHGHILGSVRTNTPDEQTVTPSTLHDTTKTLISGSFNKGAVSASFAQKGAVSASFAQSSAVTASLRSHVLTSALSGSTTLISGSVASTGSFGSIYTDKNVNASAFVGDGSSLTGIDIPTAAAISGSFISKADKSAISGSIVSGVSGSALSTGSFGRVEVAGDLSVTGTGQGWVKISQLNLTGDDANSATFTFADVFDTTYDVYMATLSNIHVDADGTALNMVYDIGGLQTGAYYGFHSQNVEGDGASYNASADKDGTNIELLADLGNAAGEVLSGIIYFYAPGDDNNMNTSSAHMFTMNTGSSPRGGTSHHNFTNSIAACTGFALDLTSGNFDDGTVTVYGLKN